MAKRILIVDDAVFMRMKLKDILEKNGYEVAGEAQNGQEAFDKYQAEKPDLVTMDITMPEVDGLQALKMIKQADANAKVVMCSAMGQQGMVMDSQVPLTSSLSRSIRNALSSPWTKRFLNDLEMILCR